MPAPQPTPTRHRPVRRYKIKAPHILGRHAVVLLAQNMFTNRRVALKFSAHPEQFERERAALQRLSST